MDLANQFGEGPRDLHKVGMHGGVAAENCKIY